MNNLFISYDLYREGQNYDAVAKAIQAMGAAIKAHKSVWYVRSSLTAEQAVKRLQLVIDANDQVMAIDATNNAAYWNKLPPGVAEFIQRQWTNG